LHNRPVTLAVIIGAHGVTGEVRLKLFSESFDAFKTHKSFNDGALTLQSIRAGNTVIARFHELKDRNAAEAARGTELTVARDALPPLAEGEYYHTDLLNLPCISTSGAALGTCIAIENYGAGDILEIERPDGGRFMVPMRVEAVPAWGAHILIDDAFVI
jgi:16S rRNA processing protein RimM